jgi:deoxyadenosine/deoxycytidine kinase
VGGVGGGGVGDTGGRTAIRGHIAIEGVIGAGKTTLAGRLAQRLGGETVLEAVEENPFLKLFYRDRGRYAFQTQIFFLLSRHAQQVELKQRDLFRELVICDYLFQKDRIFANLTLSDHELGLYNHVARLLEREVAVPDRVVYLQHSAESLIERIRNRGRPFERGVDLHYVRELNEAYNHFFFHYDLAPVLIVNSSRVDFDGREDDLEALIREIERHRHGVAYYSPGGRA